MPEGHVLTDGSNRLKRGRIPTMCARGARPKLAVLGRHTDRLQAVAAACSAAGATVGSCLIDVADRPAMANWLHAIDAANPVDLVVVSAGVSMASARRAGQIALMSSLAGFAGLTTSAAYDGSKAALRVWGESLRYALRPDGVGVSVVCPGFVDTPMNAERGSRPLLMSAEGASAIIRNGLARNRARIAFPMSTKAVIWLVNSAPGGVADMIVRRLGRQHAYVGDGEDRADTKGGGK